MRARVATRVGTALIGVAASIRAEAPAEQVQAACAIAVSVLDRQETAVNG